jgi:hypothetical protein
LPSFDLLLLRLLPGRLLLQRPEQHKDASANSDRATGDTNETVPATAAATSGTQQPSNRRHEYKIFGTDESLLLQKRARHQPSGTARNTSRVATIVAAVRLFDLGYGGNGHGAKSMRSTQHTHSALTSQLWVRLAVFWPPLPPSFWPSPPPAPCTSRRLGYSNRSTGSINEAVPRQQQGTSGTKK